MPSDGVCFTDYFPYEEVFGFSTPAGTAKNSRTYWARGALRCQAGTPETIDYLVGPRWCRKLCINAGKGQILRWCRGAHGSGLDGKVWREPASKKVRRGRSEMPGQTRAEAAPSGG